MCFGVSPTKMQTGRVIGCVLNKVDVFGTSEAEKGNECNRNGNADEK
jgi:hypothetical protein